MSSSTSWPRKDETQSASCSFFFFPPPFNSSSWDRHGTAAGSQLLKRQWLLHKHYISKQMDRAGEGEEQCREETAEKTGKKTQITATGSNSHPSRVLYTNPLVCFFSSFFFSLFLSIFLCLCFPASEKICWLWINFRSKYLKHFIHLCGRSTYRTTIWITRICINHCL